MTDDTRDDDLVLDRMRSTFGGIRVSPPPPLDTVFARSRVQRRRRATGLVTAGLAAGLTVAAGGGLAASLGGAVGGNSPGGGEPAGSPVHVQLAAFSVDSNPNGTVTVVVTPRQTLDPTVFRRLLSRAGVPAVITVDAFCRSPQNPPQTLSRVVSHQSRGDGSIVMVISPQQLGPGISLSVGYFREKGTSPAHVALGLVRSDAPMTCRSQDSSAPVSPGATTSAVPRAAVPGSVVPVPGSAVPTGTTS